MHVTSMIKEVLTSTNKYYSVGPQRMNPNHFDDPLPFPHTPPAGQNVQVSSEISQHL